MKETSGGTTKEGSLFQDRQTCNRCHVDRIEQHIKFTVLKIKTTTSGVEFKHILRTWYQQIHQPEHQFN